MLETMYAAPGIGLAAIQVGIDIRLVVLDVALPEEDHNPMILINPEILSYGDTLSSYEEGCLSIPGYYAEVERPASVEYSYINLQGEKVIGQAEGLLATCLQHEIDHLNGLLFIDHLSKLKKDMVIRRFKKLARERDKGGASL